MKFGERFRGKGKENLDREAIEPHTTEEQKQQLMSLEDRIRVRKKNAIIFSSFGHAHIDQREIESMEASLSETMQKFSYTSEQIARTIERLDAEARKEADKEREH